MRVSAVPGRDAKPAVMDMGVPSTVTSAHGTARGARVLAAAPDGVTKVVHAAGDPAALATLTALLDAVAASALTIPVAATHPLERSTQALTDVTTGKLGKMVVTVP